MKLRITIILCILMVSAIINSVFAQQDSQYTQYMYNTVTINPAYAGNRGVFSVNSLYRAQWVGLDGAPETITLSLHTPVGESERLGLGLSVSHDKIGPSKETNLVADVSYKIQVGSNTNLSFGLKGGFNVLDVDFSSLNYNPSDPLAQNVNNQFSPVVGLGLYLHGNDRWYVGLSSPNVIATDHYDDVEISTANEQAHIYLIGGYVFDLNDTIKFKPAVLAKAVSGAPTAIDLSANFLFNEKFTLGAAYRFDAAVSALAGFQVNQNIMIGYAYDYDTTELGNYNSGSHEIFLRFELGRKTQRLITPRFF